MLTVVTHWDRQIRDERLQSSPSRIRDADMSGDATVTKHYTNEDPDQPQFSIPKAYEEKLQGDRCGGGDWTTQELLVGSIPTSQDDAPNCWAYFNVRLPGV